MVHLSLKERRLIRESHMGNQDEMKHLDRKSLSQPREKLITHVSQRIRSINVELRRRWNRPLAPSPLQ